MFPEKSTPGPDMHADVPKKHTHTQTHTDHNAAPRGLGHPADSILFPLNGSCVTKGQFGFSSVPPSLPAWDLERLPCWLCGPCLFSFFFFCFILVSACLSNSSSLSPSPPSPFSPFSPFSSSQVVCRGCPGNLAGCPAECAPSPAPPPPPPSTTTSNTLPPVRPLPSPQDRQMQSYESTVQTLGRTLTDWLHSQWHLEAPFIVHAGTHGLDEGKRKAVHNMKCEEK